VKDNNLKEVFIAELRDLYSAEQQLIKALPKMAKAANSSDLREGFEQHLKQTKEHASRLEQVMSGLGEPVKGKKCKGMEGIIAESAEILSEDYEDAVMDAALIAAAQRVEHYEIAAYGCVHAYATLMGESEAASLLEQTLDEEKETNEKLTELSETINAEALGQGPSQEQNAPEKKSAKAAGGLR
jgi:ferritin-like metal-binding protein YciE